MKSPSTLSHLNNSVDSKLRHLEDWHWPVEWWGGLGTSWGRSDTRLKSLPCYITMAELIDQLACWSLSTHLTFNGGFLLLLSFSSWGTWSMPRVTGSKGQICSETKKLDFRVCVLNSTTWPWASERSSQHLHFFIRENVWTTPSLDW